VRLRIGGAALGSPRARQALSLLALMQGLVLFESALYSAITPVLPHYARQFHASKTAIGVLAAAYSAGLVPGAMLGGWLAHRLGVRRATLAGLVLFAAAVGPFGLPDGIVLLDALRFVQGVGSGLIWGGALTWVVAQTPRSDRGAALGSVIAAAVFGTLVGPVLGSAVAAAGAVGVFAVLGGCSLVLAALVRARPEPPRQTEDLSLLARGGESEAAVDSGRRAGLALSLALGIWLTLLEALTIGVVDTLLPLRLAGLGASGVVIGAIFFAAAALRTVITPPIGRLCDRRGAIVPVLAGLAIGAPLIALLPLPGSVAAVALLALIFLGGPLSAYMIPAAALITDAVEVAGGAPALATMLFNLAWAVGQTIGAPASGALAQGVGEAIPFAIVGGLMLATLPIALSAPRKPARGAGLAAARRS
jgi:DHA1 family multidrug resistance protein-like MFS transporter